MEKKDGEYFFFFKVVFLLKSSVKLSMIANVSSMIRNKKRTP